MFSTYIGSEKPIANKRNEQKIRKQTQMFKSPKNHLSSCDCAEVIANVDKAATSN